MYYFIHIPKTGGHSVMQRLPKNNIKVIGHNIRHPYYTYYKDIKKSGDKAFAVVRDPYDRVISSYNYLVQGGNNKYDALDANFYIKRYKDFNEFILKGLDKASKEQIHFKPQLDWISDGDSIIVDYLLRLEQLDDNEEVSNEFGINLDNLPVINKGPKADKSILTNDVKEKIYSVYKRDFESLNYEK